MSLKIELYERTIVFVQKIIEGRPLNSFARYVKIENLLKDKIIEVPDLEGVDFGENNDDFETLIILPKLNVIISGNIEKLIISMDNIDGTDKYFYQIAKKYSDILLKEDISALGINFNGIIKTEKKDEIIKEKIIKKFPPFFKDADTASFRISYNDNKAIFNISIDPGSIQHRRNKFDKSEGVIVSCNYHREIKNRTLMKEKMNEFQDSLEQVKLKYNKYKENIEKFLNE